MFDADLEKILRASEQHLSDSKRLQERIGKITGRAKSADGRVTVHWDGEGLNKLELDPRAMRMTSADLAEAIATTAQQAKQDLDRQSDALMEEVFGPEHNPLNATPSQEEMESKLDELQDMFGDTLKDVTNVMEQLRKAFGK